MLYLASCFSVIFTLSAVLGTPTTGGRAANAVEVFVMNFYDWYVPTIGKDRAWEAAVNRKASMFDPALLRSLREDAEAQAKFPKELVGLSFDPFLGSQDPCERYQIGSVIARGGRYRVEVLPVCDGRKLPMPAAIVEVARSGNRLSFMNFWYPKANTDLRTVLAELRSKRTNSR